LPGFCFKLFLLTINDEVVVNNPDGYQAVVYGIIQAQAAANNPVVFNSVKLNVASAGTLILDYVEFNEVLTPGFYLHFRASSNCCIPVSCTVDCWKGGYIILLNYE
jgi:hypothetical protein